MDDLGELGVDDGELVVGVAVLFEELFELLRRLAVDLNTSCRRC